jgi:hypothetical protein
VIYPKGNNTHNISLSMYLENINCKNKTAENDVCAQFSLCVVNPTDPTNFFHQGTCKYKQRCSSSSNISSS